MDGLATQAGPSSLPTVPQYDIPPDAEMAEQSATAGGWNLKQTNSGDMVDEDISASQGPQEDVMEYDGELVEVEAPSSDAEVNDVDIDSIAAAEEPYDTHEIEMIHHEGQPHPSQDKAPGEGARSSTPDASAPFQQDQSTYRLDSATLPFETGHADAVSVPEHSEEPQSEEQVRELPLQGQLDGDVTAAAANADSGVKSDADHADEGADADNSKIDGNNTEVEAHQSPSQPIENGAQEQDGGAKAYGQESPPVAGGSDEAHSGEAEVKADPRDEKDENDDEGSHERAEEEQGDHAAQPIRVTFNDQSFALFSASLEAPSFLAYSEAGDSIQSVSAPRLNLADDIYWKSLEDLFHGLRVQDALGEFLEEAETGNELVMHMPELELTIREDSVHAGSVHLHELVEMHEGLGLQDSLHIKVREEPSFIGQFNLLAAQISHSQHESLDEGAGSGDEQDEVQDREPQSADQQSTADLASEVADHRVGVDQIAPVQSTPEDAVDSSLNESAVEGARRDSLSRYEPEPPHTDVHVEAGNADGDAEAQEETVAECNTQDQSAIPSSVDDEAEQTFVTVAAGFEEDEGAEADQTAEEPNTYPSQPPETGLDSENFTDGDRVAVEAENEDVSGAQATQEDYVTDGTPAERFAEENHGDPNGQQEELVEYEAELEEGDVEGDEEQSNTANGVHIAADEGLANDVAEEIAEEEAEDAGEASADQIEGDRSEADRLAAARDDAEYGEVAPSDVSNAGSPLASEVGRASSGQKRHLEAENVEDASSNVTDAKKARAI